MSETLLNRHCCEEPDLLLGTSMPVRRFAPVVSNREDCDGGWRFEVHHMIWKAPHGNPPDRQVLGNAWDWSASARPPHDVVPRRINCLQELHTEPWPLVVVPTAGLVELSCGLGLDADGAVHPLAKLRAMRSRTSSHRSPTDSPESTRCARRSISRAHAACTAASSAGAGSSRLASSSAATSARSSAGNAKASRSNSWVRDVMTPL